MNTDHTRDSMVTDSVTSRPSQDTSTARALRILSDASASRWLKEAIMASLSRDPVQAANDAELLYGILAQRCDEAATKPEGALPPIEAVINHLNRKG